MNMVHRGLMYTGADVHGTTGGLMCMKVNVHGTPVCQAHSWNCSAFMFHPVSASILAPNILTQESAGDSDCKWRSHSYHVWQQSCSVFNRVSDIKIIVMVTWSLVNVNVIKWWRYNCAPITSENTFDKKAFQTKANCPLNNRSEGSPSEEIWTGPEWLGHWMGSRGEEGWLPSAHFWPDPKPGELPSIDKLRDRHDWKHYLTYTCDNEHVKYHSIVQMDIWTSQKRVLTYFLVNILQKSAEKWKKLAPWIRHWICVYNCHIHHE